MTLNIILIGMPGAGKSTLGVLLAKALGMNFVDSDIVIQQRTGKLLQEIINKDGIDTFLSTEEDVLCSLNVTDSVVATGGSAVYSEKAMNHLKKSSVVIYVKVEFEEIKKRITNITTRGIVLKHGKSLGDAFFERVPLYERYADVTIDCTGQTIETSVAAVLEKLKAF